jgi:hypothetical protein
MIRNPFVKGWLQDCRWLNLGNQPIYIPDFCAQSRRHWRGDAQRRVDAAEIVPSEMQR